MPGFVPYKCMQILLDTGMKCHIFTKGNLTTIKSFECSPSKKPVMYTEYRCSYNKLSIHKNERLQNFTVYFYAPPESHYKVKKK